MKNKNTSFIQSLFCARQGIVVFFHREVNARVHLGATLLLVMAMLIIPLSNAEQACLVLAAGMVWAMEIINTVMEEVMDHVSPERHPAVRRIKDMAAGSVLVAASTAILVGAFILLPKIYNYVF